MSTCEVLTTRRGFCRGALACAVPALPVFAEPAAGDAVRFLVASDIHYRPEVFPHDTADWVSRIVARGVSAQVDFGLQLGDFVHDVHRASEAIGRWRSAPFPTYSVAGNHDDDGSSPEDTRSALGMSGGCYRFDCKGFRFLVLDTNWAAVDGRYRHYGKNCGFSYYKLPRNDRMRLHPDELAWLERELEHSPYPCVISSHVRLNGPCPDSPAILSLIAAANQKHPGRVRLLLNGHEHVDRFETADGVAWLTVNSANHHWVPRRHAAYPAEDTRRWREIDHVIAYDTPLSAIVELHADGTLRIEGTSGGFWRNITPEAAGFSDVRCTPSIADRSASCRPR